MANRAFPQRVTRELLVSITIVLAWLRMGRTFVGRGHAQELAAMLQLVFAVSIAQEPVIANAVESTGENVEEESPDELLGRESHDFLLIVVAVVPPVELDLPVFDIQQSMVGNRDTVRVATHVVHHLLGSGEGRLCVDDPFHVAHWIEMPAENLRISKGLEGREEPEFAGLPLVSQTSGQPPDQSVAAVSSLQQNGPAIGTAQPLVELQYGRLVENVGE